MVSESSLQQLVQIEHCKRTMGQMWRNNSGACEDKSGRIIRYGLGHTSSQQIKHWASSDLIGITPTLITEEMVGYYLGVFTAYEIKRPGWKKIPSDIRATAQEKFIDIVKSSCGYAGFVTDVADIEKITGR